MAPLVALAGFMGSGKSSVGALSARLLGWRFLDLDDEIARGAGMTIAEFFALHGEPAFRQREVEVLKELLSRSEQDAAAGEGMVLALGGGTLQDAQAARLLEERGGVVFLDIDRRQGLGAGARRRQAARSGPRRFRRSAGRPAPELRADGGLDRAGRRSKCGRDSRRDRGSRTGYGPGMAQHLGCAVGIH